MEVSLKIDGKFNRGLLNELISLRSNQPKIQVQVLHSKIQKGTMLDA